MNLIADGCRLCLHSSAERYTTIDNPALKDQMGKVFCFSIEPKQGYCSGVCQKCSHTISEFYQYSEKVRQNQEVLIGNVTTCDQIKDSNISLECVKQEPLNNVGLPETKEDAPKPDSEVSEVEEAPILNSHITQENDNVQKPSDSEIMKTNQDACGPIDEVPEVEEEVHGLHSEITLEDFKIEIPDSDLSSDESGKTKTPSASELSETTEQIVKRPNRKEEDQLFKKHFEMICDLCRKPADSYTALCSHMKKVHKRRKGYVVCCNKKLLSRSQVREHINFHANPDMFRCEVCGRTFKKQDTLNVHMLKKHPQTHKCKHCPRSFVAESALIDHMKLHIKCPKCNKLFTNQSIRNHMIQKHKEQDAHKPDSEVSNEEETSILASKIPKDNAKIQTPSASEIMETNQDACELLDEISGGETADEENETPFVDTTITFGSGRVESPSKDELSETPEEIIKDTLIRKEEDELFKKHISLVCELCGISADSYLALYHHFKEEHKKRYCYVVCCNKKLFHRSQIREHINFHANPDMFRCKVCGVRFKRRDSLNVHTLKKHPQIHKCNHCPQIFSEETALTKHMKLHQELQMKLHCPKCNELCTKDSFRNHMIKKHGDKQLKMSCDICDKEFTSMDYFDQHMKMHMGIESQRFKCKICLISFRKERGLNLHMKTHHATTTEVQCDKCPRKFKHPRALTSHMLWWHTEPKNECEHCGQKYKLPYLLKEHIAVTHTGEALYNCEYCGTSFSRKSIMDNHIQSAHPAEWAQKKLMKKKRIDLSESGRPLKTSRVTFEKSL